MTWSSPRNGTIRRSTAVPDPDLPVKPGGPWLFAVNYGLGGWRAMIAPVAVPDSFIIVGEGMLFVGLVRNWTDRPYHRFAWLLAATGFAISVAGNVGHLHTATWPERAMFIQLQALGYLDDYYLDDDSYALDDERACRRGLHDPTIPCAAYSL